MRHVADALARAFLSGPWTPRSMRARGLAAVPALGHPRFERVRGTLAGVVRRVRRAFPEPPPEVSDALVDLVAAGLRRRLRTGLLGKAPRAPLVARWFLTTPRMAPSPWPVPAIPTVAELARWLRLDVPDLQWLADPKGLGRHAEAARLQNYRYRWVPKPHGGARLLEAPKPRLREAQRAVLHGILNVVPPHDAAHGFRAGRSPLTCAAPHVGHDVLVRLDLEDFFPSVRSGAVLGVFRAAGYPWAVARHLAALCTSRVPGAALRARPPGGDLDAAWRQARRLATPHLPSGAPTSPALANLCAWRLDVRLAALADRIGATYTRYADDLAFSGDADLRRRAPRLVPLVAAVASEEGFRLNLRKTCVAGRGARQQVAGVVVNARPTVPRDRYDALRALLHNCAVHGPSTQDRVGGRDFRAHVEGRVAAVAGIDAGRGERLARMLAKIDWSR